MSTRVDDPGSTPVVASIPRHAVVIVVDGTASQSQAVDWAASMATAHQRPLALLALRPAPPGSAATLERELLVVGKHRAWASDRGATDRVHSGVVEKVACPVEIVPVASS